jgi:hypothetical protein
LGLLFRNAANDTYCIANGYFENSLLEHGLLKKVQKESGVKEL